MKHRATSQLPSPRFQTTRWSLVLKAGDPSAKDSRQALEELAQSYWYPLYAFSRRQGNGDQDAMDLTQEFFMHLLCGEALRSVAAEKGRFRSFLLASFKNFSANQRRSAATLRRGGDIATFSLTSYHFNERYDREPAHIDTPESQYQRSWAEALLGRVFSRLEQDYYRVDKQRLFDLLKPHLKGSSQAVARVDIGRELNLSSAAVAMSLYRMRQRYGELLREEVAATVDDPSEVEDEIRNLMSALSSLG